MLWRHMRIVVHDYSGHPFQVQLSRELASLGHEVLHLYSASFQTPKGGVQPRAGDPPSFTVEGICLAGRFSKYDHFIRRRRQEIRYGKLAARRIAIFRPDIVLSANTPLDAQRLIQKAARVSGARFVFWLQDIYSAGISECLRKKKFPLASFVGGWYRRVERDLLRRSDAIVAISADFAQTLETWGIDPGRIHTIENWAPWGELLPCAQDNFWSRLHALAGKFVFLYSGTIGMKHNPTLLLDLGEAMRNDPDIAVVVISEGVGADWLRDQARLRGLHNLHCLPLQPYEVLSEIFSTGSVLIALLDESAGEFSVPSKVLSYMCVGRPLLLSVPERNAAARMVRDHAAGVVVPPGDSAAFLGAAHQLYRDRRLREMFGANAHACARTSFDIQPIARRFAQVCASTSQARPAVRALAAGTH
jgi:colanic acid biosynthesis glycosyl transferase WcaI